MPPVNIIMLAGRTSATWTAKGAVVLPKLRLTCLCLLLFCLPCLTQAQTYTIIHDFSGPDGAIPSASLTIDSGGRLYGTTVSGGSHDVGTVFRMTPHNQAWTFTTLFSFDYDSTGGDPWSPVVFGPDGALYGTTQFGGRGTTGVVFKLQPPPTVCVTTFCPWAETVLAAFDGTHGTPNDPSGQLSFDTGGNLYGTTTRGGNYDDCLPTDEGCGTVYRLVKSDHWAVDTIYQFTGATDGAQPQGGVIFDHAGNLYGNAFENNFEGGGGDVFQLSASGVGWTFNLLFQFQCADSGCWPYSGLIFDQADNLFGETTSGSTGGGTVFQLSQVGGRWNFNLLYSFTGSTGPYSSLMMDQAGNLYGTTFRDGTHNCGSAFKLAKNNGNYTYTDLHDFTCNGTDGKHPVGGLVMDSDGNLYGTTQAGGTTGNGIVFEITP